jgi:zinc transport system substrate-binding protein
MLRKLSFVSAFLGFLYLPGIISAAEQTQPLKVVVTTSLISTIVQAIGKDRIDVVTIVSTGMCPGHFDVKPADIAELSDAKLLFSHGFEGWVDKLVNSSGNKELVASTMSIEGNWMVPEVHKRAAQKITSAVSTLDPQHENWYKSNLSAYETSIDSVSVLIDKLTITFKDTKVVCAKHQSEFLDWLGLDVITSYGRPEEMTPTNLIEVLRIVRAEDVRLVVDNLQSGGKAGRTIAEQIEAKHITLTNFPLGNSYIASLMENVEKVVKALE